MPVLIDVEVCVRYIDIDKKYPLSEHRLGQIIICHTQFQARIGVRT